ncbi:hypothetical protein GY21_19610 [Cryobacterium roopkundense]|uniref:Major facilitator superfamily (MFS) profile domain-containing protein n=1 Tax=Cryobacterium roopkundense TaxID=1001240 RepID=A0A099J061_9MICO|nr:hypothetical protein [Cryobacterium roopkundense]KGJ71819.1 hypothetical protein GY21_19610 [Cryobacterium roopkundense]MBB5640657.1 hypothetical protein [Cryobacterium roopkundense]
MSWVLLAATIAMGVGGILAYRGVWTSWASRPLGYGVGFMLLYVAIGAGAIRLAEVFVDVASVEWLAVVLLFVGIAAMVLAVVSLVWLPKFLTPRWFNAVRGR